MNKPGVIRLNRTQIRQIIKEAIQVREPGSPLFTPPTLIKESIDSVVEPLGDWLGKYFMSQYDPGGADIDEDSWRVQVDVAVDDIVSNLIDKFQEVEEALHNGKYADLNSPFYEVDDAGVDLPPRHPRARDDKSTTSKAVSGASTSSSPNRSVSTSRPEPKRGYSGRSSDDVELPPMHPRGRR